MTSNANRWRRKSFTVKAGRWIKDFTGYTTIWLMVIAKNNWWYQTTWRKLPSALVIPMKKVMGWSHASLLTWMRCPFNGNNRRYFFFFSSLLLRKMSRCKHRVEKTEDDHSLKNDKKKYWGENEKEGNAIIRNANWNERRLEEFYLFIFWGARVEMGKFVVETVFFRCCKWCNRDASRWFFPPFFRFWRTVEPWHFDW